jgi:hypothetical protein
LEEQKPQQLQLVDRNETEYYVWNLVKDSEPVPYTAPEEYTDGIGLCGFDFPEEFNLQSGKAYAFPYLKLLQKMWPGDWKLQLKQLNIKIAADNNAMAGKKQRIKLVSEQEWWVFIGIIISAGPQGKGGSKLWEKASHREGRGMTKPINYGPDGEGIMAHYRFKEVKAAFPWSFQDKSKEPRLDEGGSEVVEEGKDSWHIIMGMVDGYNKNRHDWVAASIGKVLDESMSAYRPRTSKTGGLPHLSFILRKPEPLGTELKTIACAETGMLSSVLLCQPFVALLGATSLLCG